MSAGIKEIIRYGTNDADITGQVIESEPFLKVSVGDHVVNTQLVGAYNLPNALAAFAVGKHFGVDETKIVTALEGYAPSNSRSQLIEKDGNRIILDAYNANPSSMRAAIENFHKISAGDKVLVLGAMAELGAESLKEHREIVNLIEKYRWKDVALVGGDFLKIETPFKTFGDSAEAAKWLHANRFKNTYLLVKGSRSMRMEKVLEE
jgi:UDP-N-acetylmuramoyl-tripeptide--D-alanyl-D-alanine ligase